MSPFLLFYFGNSGISNSSVELSSIQYLKYLGILKINKKKNTKSFVVKKKIKKQTLVH